MGASLSSPLLHKHGLIIVSVTSLLPILIAQGLSVDPILMKECASISYTWTYFRSLIDCFHSNLRGDLFFLPTIDWLAIDVRRGLLLHLHRTKAWMILQRLNIHRVPGPVAVDLTLLVRIVNESVFPGGKSSQSFILRLLLHCNVRGRMLPQLQE